MATGIPGKTKDKGSLKTSSKLSFRLEYEGKVSIDEIFNTLPAELHRVFSIDKQPKNRLIYGENLRVIRALLNNVDIAGKVGLIYIDPPYATGLGFESRKHRNEQNLQLGECDRDEK